MSKNTGNKLTFSAEQLVPSSIASKNFGQIRRRAQNQPLFITDNGVIDTVVLGYKEFERMYQRLQRLEHTGENKLLK